MFGGGPRKASGATRFCVLLLRLSFMLSNADNESMIWKSDWVSARHALEDWWAGRGLALSVTAPKNEPWEDVPPPPPGASLETRWLDPLYRARSQLYHMSRTFYGGAAFPNFSADVGGPGSLGLFLGCVGSIAEETVWYEPSIRDPNNHKPIRFDPENEWWRLHVAAIEEGRKYAEGRYVIGFPDLIENLDTLTQLRGPQETLMDMVERPVWVEARIREINAAFYEVYDRLLPQLRDPWGGTAWHAFGIWGPGKTAKVQCDACCMISPAMFRRFVQPALAEQCAWLDNALYHLDGTQALPQLDNLLSIQSLKAIEWTPQDGLPGGGSPLWYDLYRRIRKGGKAVQAIGVAPHEVEPLLDAVGPEGLFIMTWASSEAEARDLLRRVGWKEA
jgi:hypothetical protein